MIDPVVTAQSGIVVASVLLVAGIFWLARTVSTTELMLNAVALNAILDAWSGFISHCFPSVFVVFPCLF